MHFFSSHFEENKGFSLIEALLAIAVFTTLVSGLGGSLIYAHQSAQESGQRIRASYLAAEAIEVLRNIESDTWNEFVYSQSAIEESGGVYILSGEGTDETIGSYTRTITFSDVCRDGLDVIVDCPGVSTDLHTKHVRVDMIWDGWFNSKSLDIETYLTNWRASDWIQTDWSGGSGQAVWLDETQYDSDDGNIYIAQSGQVSLQQITSSESTQTWSFDSLSNYMFDSDAIEVTAGKAQLKGSGSGSSGSLVDTGFEYTESTSFSWDFDSSSDYVFDSEKIEVSGSNAQLVASGGSAINGGTTNSSFDTESTGWTYGDWSQNGGDPNAIGTWYGSSGNPQGYVDVNLPSDLKNKTVGGYWEQSFVTTIDNPDTVTCEIDWKAFTATLPSQGVDSLYVAAYIETSSGEPSTTPVLQKDFTSTFDWESHSGVNGFDCSSAVTMSGTYYYKFAVWADGVNKTTGPIRVGFDNAKVSWEHTTSGSYPTDNPNIYPTNTSYVVGVQSFDSFTETATKNGGEIYYQLSDDGGVTWQYWNGASWSLAMSSTHYNNAVVVDTNISSFSITNEQISFRAFLESDGTQQVQLDGIEIGITPSASVWSFSDWDVFGGEVAPTGLRQSSGGNPNNYVEITVPASSNDDVGGYWEQSFVTTNDNPSATLDFDYSVVDFNGVPNTSEIRVYVDSASGIPVNQVGTISVGSEGSWISATTIDVSSALGVAGMYYVKMAYWVETPGAGGAGPFTIGFDNVDLSWSSSSYSSTKPTVQNTTSFSPSVITEWTSFEEVAVKSGGEIYYQLSDDGGITWQYWDGASWQADPDGDEGVSENDYNTASDVNAYISQFNVINSDFVFRAFLVSDGSQLIQLDSISVSYNLGSTEYIGNQFTVDAFFGAGVLDTSTNTQSLRFSAKDDKTVDGLRVYVEQIKGVSPTYRIGLQFDNAGQPSGLWMGLNGQAYADISPSITGWNSVSLLESPTISSGTTYHIVIQYQSGTINGGNAIELRQSSPNTFVHAYDSSDNNFSNTLWSSDGVNWAVTGYQPIYVLDFADLSYSGNPYHEFSEHEIYGDNFFGEQFVSGFDQPISSLSFLVSENNEGPEDDLLAYLYDVTNDVTLASGILAQATDLTINVYSYQSVVFFKPIMLTSGNVYRIYLSSPNSTVQKHYLVRSVFHDNDSVYRSSNYNSDQSFFVSSLDSGSNWSSDIDSDIAGFRFAQTVYQSSGWLLSSAYNMSQISSVQIIDWDEEIPTCTPECDVKLQIRTTSDASGSPDTGNWTDWYGISGSGSYFSEVQPTIISQELNEKQWVQYRVELLSDGTRTPVLQEVRVNYQ